MIKRLLAHLTLLRVASDRIRRDKNFVDELKAWRHLRDSGQLNWEPRPLPKGAPPDVAKRFDF